MVRTAEAIRFSQAVRSCGVALRRETVDLAGGRAQRARTKWTENGPYLANLGHSGQEVGCLAQHRL